MGAFRSIIDSFDSSDELAQVQKEAVEALARVALEKADVFEFQIKEKLRTAGTSDNRTIPIGAILASTKQTHAYSSKSAGSINDVVTSSLKSFATGTKDDIVDGVSSLIGAALTTFLGAASAATGTLQQYYVMTEGLAVVRIDLSAWYFNVSSQSIYSKMERATAFCAVKSSVDLSKIDFNTFLYLYQEQLQKGGLTTEQLAKALADAREIYKQFREVTGGEDITPTEIAHAPAAPLASFSVPPPV